MVLVQEYQDRCPACCVTSNDVEKDGNTFSYSNHRVYFFFSSPEHNVLIVSFCDRPMSVVHNFFKHLLLLNHWANLAETWQGCSLGEALPKLFKRLNSTHNSGCRCNQKEKKKIAKSLKIFFSKPEGIEL